MAGMAGIYRYFLVFFCYLHTLLFTEIVVLLSEETEVLHSGEKPLFFSG